MVREFSAGGVVLRLRQGRWWVAVIEPQSTRKAAAYQTSKFALVGLSAALRAEYAGTGLGVTALCPGFVRTSAGAAIVTLLREKSRKQTHHERAELRRARDSVLQLSKGRVNESG